MNEYSLLNKNWKQFATFPCRGNAKFPATRKGFKDAQFGQDVLAMVNQGYNVGLACATSKVIVIDIDYHNEDSTAMDDLRKLELELGTKLPVTLTQSTASGNGRHLIYSAKGIITPRGKIGKNVDVKYNGYIMVAPSSINGRFYQIIDGIDENGNFILAELPQVWLDYLNSAVKNTGKNTPRSVKSSEYPRKTYENLDIDRMFRNCAFLKYCKDNAEDLSEPMWHSMITCLAQIKNSDELIHSLSEPYSEYSFEETQKKIDYARQFGYPQSCAYLSANYPEICRNCHSCNTERMV